MPTNIRLTWNAPQRSRSCCQLSDSVVTVHVTICLMIGIVGERPTEAEDFEYHNSRIPPAYALGNELSCQDRFSRT